jgi:hypothetical protein
MGRRDKVVNTLLGIFLLVTALAIFLAFVGASWLGLSVIRYLADFFFPGVVLPASLTLFAVYGACSLAAGVKHMRRRLWRNAFLCFSVLPVIAFVWLSHPSSPLGPDSFLSLWFVFMVLFTPEQSLIPRPEFFLAASVISEFVIVASGLVGSGAFAHFISICTRLSAVVLFVIQVRRNQKAMETRITASPIVA